MSTSSTNPGTWMTGTTWARFANGRVLVGVDDNDSDFAVNKTGGSKTHKLTKSEMPTDLLQFPVGSDTSNPVSSGGSFYAASGEVGTNRGYNGTPISLLQPYISVYIWRRIA